SKRTKKKETRKKKKKKKKIYFLLQKSISYYQKLWSSEHKNFISPVLNTIYLIN
ncbi:unnamed protein product, partial [Heterobilharzia americana]